MEYLFIYLLQIFDSLTTIKTGLIYFILAIIILIFVYVLNYPEVLSNNENTQTNYCNEIALFQILKKLFIIVLSTFIILLFIPEKETLLLMSGTYYGKKAVNAIVTSEKSQKVNKIIDLQLDKYIKDLKKEQ